MIRLKLAATLTGREQRELATQAVITFCTAILTRKLGKDVNHEHLAVALDETLQAEEKEEALRNFFSAFLFCPSFPQASLLSETAKRLIGYILRAQPQTRGKRSL